jgi:hypothetical protein
MAIKTKLSFLFWILFLFSNRLSAQQLIIANGGLFGSQTDFVNLGIYDSRNGNFISLDTVKTNSVQDVLVENDRFVYLAAQDSIIKYDVQSGQRVAVNSFGATSTIRLGIYQNKLIVGNWYGNATGNLRIFDKNDLTFIDSIPEITKGATDFVVIANKAYVAQNNTNSNYMDTLGYLSVVDLDNLNFLYNDTLSNSGDEIGRLINVGDSAIYSINGNSNTISSLNILNGTKNTVLAAAVLNPRYTGISVFFDGNKWYLPFNNGIGTFDIVNNSVIQSDIVVPPAIVSPGAPATSFAFAVDPDHNKIYMSIFDFVSQQNNRGLIFDLNGDSTGVFPVGFSPEVLGILNNPVGLATELLNDSTFEVFPNPCSDFLLVKSTGEISNIKIINQLGQLVSEFESPLDNEYQINTSSLEPGLYFLKIGRQSTVFLKK